MKLSERKKQVLAAIIDYQSTHGYTPRLEDIGKMIGTVKNNVKKSVDSLEADGIIIKAGWKSEPMHVVVDKIADLG